MRYLLVIVTSRLDGLAKTPDIVLEYPILVNTNKYPLFIVIWITFIIVDGKKSTGLKAKQFSEISIGLQ